MSGATALPAKTAAPDVARAAPWLKRVRRMRIEETLFLTRWTRGYAALGLLGAAALLWLVSPFDDGAFLGAAIAFGAAGMLLAAIAGLRALRMMRMELGPPFLKRPSFAACLRFVAMAALPLAAVLIGFPVKLALTTPGFKSEDLAPAARLFLVYRVLDKGAALVIAPAPAPSPTVKPDSKAPADQVAARLAAAQAAAGWAAEMLPQIDAEIRKLAAARPALVAGRAFEQNWASERQTLAAMLGTRLERLDALIAAPPSPAYGEAVVIDGSTKTRTMFNGAKPPQFSARGVTSAGPCSPDAPVLTACLLLDRGLQLLVLNGGAETDWSGRRYADIPLQPAGRNAEAVATPGLWLTTSPFQSPPKDADGATAELPASIGAVAAAGAPEPILILACVLLLAASALRVERLHAGPRGFYLISAVGLGGALLLGDGVAAITQGPAFSPLDSLDRSSVAAQISGVYLAGVLALAALLASGPPLRKRRPFAHGRLARWLMLLLPVAPFLSAEAMAETWYLDGAGQALALILVPLAFLAIRRLERIAADANCAPKPR